MDESDLPAKATSILIHDPELSILLENPPVAIVMPFCGDHSKRYLVVNAVLIEQASHLKVIASFCGRVVHLLRMNGVLDELDGLEVIPCVIQTARPKRVLRLSILSGAIDKAEELTEKDLRLPKPANGITCILYFKEIE